VICCLLPAPPGKNADLFFPRFFSDFSFPFSRTSSANRGVKIYPGLLSVLQLISNLEALSYVPSDPRQAFLRFLRFSLHFPPISPGPPSALMPSLRPYCYKKPPCVNTQIVLCSVAHFIPNLIPFFPEECIEFQPASPINAVSFGDTHEINVSLSGVDLRSFIPPFETPPFFLLFLLQLPFINSLVKLLKETDGMDLEAPRRAVAGSFPHFSAPFASPFFPEFGWC